MLSWSIDSQKSAKLMKMVGDFQSNSWISQNNLCLNLFKRYRDLSWEAVSLVEIMNDYLWLLASWSSITEKKFSEFYEEHRWSILTANDLINLILILWNEVPFDKHDALIRHLDDHVDQIWINMRDRKYGSKNPREDLFDPIEP